MMVKTVLYAPMQSALRRFRWISIERLLLVVILVLQLVLILNRNRDSRSGDRATAPSNLTADASTETVGERGGAQEPFSEDRPDLSLPSPSSGRIGLGWPAWARMAPYPQEEIRQLMTRDWERLQRAPAMDVVEQPDAFVVLFSMPNVEDDEINVSMERGILTLDLPIGSAREGHYGRLVRRLQIPGVAANVTNPHYLLTNGVLRVYLPKLLTHAAYD